MKATQELRALSATELQNRLKEFKKELLKLRVEVGAGSGSTSAGKVKRTKKNIARVLTILNEKEGHQ
ncbi:50S ribosomal protein L29 [Candidatus Woesearchaeota archaeon]|nr:50S ribosomal protein L29 [Candidatus Woesearchaeota archaeon]MBI2581801.1 50S ribosomal protein L29 [Candidatus Woesearchaeota archaeon]HLD78999.1 50S ribosomal protein L29 [Candidatus Nanoarchaeia archaeon]